MYKPFFLVVVVLALLRPCQFASADDAKEIKRLIPYAAAVNRRAYQKIAMPAVYPWFESNSLTWIVLYMPNADEDTDAREDFSFLPGVGPIAPNALAKELDRADHGAKTTEPKDPSRRPTVLSELAFAASALNAGPVTAIHEDRITEFTCEIQGNRATGSVSFEAPELYRGKVMYVAERTAEAWRITEFKMPKRGIHIVWEKGLWKLHQAKALLVESPPFQTWTDASGQHKIEAACVSYWDGKVRLLKRDGQIIAVPPEKLSEQNRQWLTRIIH